MHERPRLRVDDRRRAVTDRRSSDASGSGSAAALAETARLGEERLPLASEHVAEALVFDAGRALEELVHPGQPLERRDVRRARSGPRPRPPSGSSPVPPRRAPGGRPASARPPRPNRNASRAMPSGDPTFATRPLPRRTRAEPSRVRSCGDGPQPHQDLGRQLGHRHRVRGGRSAPWRSSAPEEPSDPFADARSCPDRAPGRGPEACRTRGARRARCRSTRTATADVRAPA